MKRVKEYEHKQFAKSSLSSNIINWGLQL